MIRFPIAALAAMTAAIVITPAQAYYHYVHYLNGNLNAPVYERFDLSALTAKTVTFFVADTGPQNFGPNDDFSSVLSQVQQAAAAWNSVSSSDLRVAFGGLESPGQAANVPGGDVIFTELPPGLLGMGGVSVATGQQPVNGPNGVFFPVARSLVQLTADTSQAPGPSYLESFFTTAVHELGHALGLQHTWTSAAMSQDVIRNTSRARPLDADDRAALSVLYGRSGWNAAFGSISGRVTANGQGVALASVVAIPPDGPAVSALTNPDGSYTISGLPVGNYLLYVHPLPPDAIVPSGWGLKLPVDQNNQPLPAFASAFGTIFAMDSGGPTSFSITPGKAVTGQNFSVQPQSTVSMYDVITYSYSANGTRNTPAFVSSTASQFTFGAQSNPPLVTPVPQSITILGGFGTATLCANQNATLPCFLPYDSNTGARLPPSTTSPATELAVYFNVPLFANTGPRHVVFTLSNGDMYVLPDGVNLVQRNPPAISSINQNGDSSVTIAGSSFGTDSSVFFDGLPTTIVTPFSGTAAQGSISVVPPSGYSSQQASVIVYNSDGQNSTFYQSQAPPLYYYPSSGTPQVTLNPLTLPAGVSSIVDIKASNMQFVDGEVTLGLGTSDISVRRVWVVSPTHAIANVVVAPNAAIGSSEISVIAGFQTANQPAGFQILPANPSTPFVALPLMNNDPTQSGFYPGAVVSIYGSALSSASGTAQITLNGQSLQILYASPAQINFVIPNGFPTGLETLTVSNGSATSPPFLLQVDNPPAVSASH
ncbi:MAG: carboxypeptidase regulatory-like domain-containing protein [Acidobacteriia bacterium]|nr:carboxypeptidase regulatory-like domain-containing protein [Terriglobia bacterium]